MSMDNFRYEQPSMSEWSGRIDSDDDYDAFRWHQWATPLDLLNGPGEIPGRLRFAFLGFCCDEGIRRNQGKPGASKGRTYEVLTLLPGIKFCLVNHWWDIKRSESYGSRKTRFDGNSFD